MADKIKIEEEIIIIDEGEENTEINETEERNNNYCSVCRKTFSNPEFFARHERECGDNGDQIDKEFTHLQAPECGVQNYCNICNKTFTTLRNFQRHTLLHTGEKPFSCNVCNKTFARKDRLKEHTRTHTGDKPYTCNICDQGFTQKHNLEHHDCNVNNGDKSFACNICNIRFSAKSNLKQHVGVHVGEKPFSCRYCGKKFRLLSNMRTHERGVHVKDKLFKCTFCNRSFSYPKDLKQHCKKNHSTDKLYSCKLCGKSFTHLVTFKLHEKNCHPVEETQLTAEQSENSTFYLLPTQEQSHEALVEERPDLCSWQKTEQELLTGEHGDVSFSLFHPQEHDGFAHVEESPMSSNIQQNILSLERDLLTDNQGNNSFSQLHAQQQSQEGCVVEESTIMKMSILSEEDLARIGQIISFQVETITNPLKQEIQKINDRLSTMEEDIGTLKYFIQPKVAVSSHDPNMLRQQLVQPTAVGTNSNTDDVQIVDLDDES